MTIAATTARILLGIIFTLAGLSGFFISHPPAQPGLAGTFNDVFFQSHWILFVAAAQLVIGVLLLLNRFVPVALMMLAAFLYNSFAFHLTMSRAALPAPTIVLALWVLVSLPHRRLFAQLFAARAG
jgi:putative oxidoreductase